MKITYTKRGDICFSDLALPSRPTENIGRFGRMRRRYRKEHRKLSLFLCCQYNIIHLADGRGYNLQGAFNDISKQRFGCLSDI